MAKIAFFGTPAFAAQILQEINQICTTHNHELCFIVCQPDKLAKRGKKVLSPQTKIYALEHGLRVFQPESLRKAHLKGQEFYEFFDSQQVDLAIVVAYGKIIPRRFLNNAKQGFMNVHASILPRWRGAAPIQRAIEAGDTETGITYIDLTSKLDAGDVYSMHKIPIEPTDTTVQLTEKLVLLTKSTIKKTVLGILSESLPKTSQPDAGITYAHMLSKSQGLINWHQDAEQIVNQARAMHPWPGSFIYYKGKLLKLFDAQKCQTDNPDKQNKMPPGTILDAKDYLIVACENSSICFLNAQIEGKKRMKVSEISNGNYFCLGDCFDSV